VGRISQELLQQIFVSVNDRQSRLIRILPQGFQPPLILLVGVDIGIEKISYNLVSFSLEVLERVDSTVGATNMKQDFHLFFSSDRLNPTESI
jgi:hypothetical protein